MANFFKHLLDKCKIAPGNKEESTLAPKSDEYIYKPGLESPPESDPRTSLGNTRTAKKLNFIPGKKVSDLSDKVLELVTQPSVKSGKVSTKESTVSSINTVRNFLTNNFAIDRVSLNSDEAKGNRQSNPSRTKRSNLSTIEERVGFLKSKHYNFSHEVDRGAFGTVYQGSSYDQKKGKYFVAIKRINMTSKENKKFVAKFLSREILTHSSLRHPNIVKYYDTLVQDTSDIYLILEWLPKGTLLDHCRLLGRLPDQTVKSISKQLLSALT